jgi:hypothetical protein
MVVQFAIIHACAGFFLGFCFLLHLFISHPAEKLLLNPGMYLLAQKDSLPGINQGTHIRVP